jgi:hypothetical protein
VRFHAISSDLSAQKAAWESCRKAADALKIRESWQDNAQGFDEWRHNNEHWKMLKMATYAPDNNAPDVAIHVVDQWRKAKPPKKQRTNLVDEDGFEVVQRNMNAPTVKGSNDEEDEDEQMVEDDEEEEEEVYAEFNPEAQREILSRYTDEPEIEFDTYKTPEEIVEAHVQRDVRFKPTEKSKEQLAKRNLHSLSAADRVKLIKSWGELLQLDAQVDLDQRIEDYRKAAAINVEYEAKVDAFILKSASAIGMTTNGAAKYIRCGAAPSLFPQIECFTHPLCLYAVSSRSLPLTLMQDSPKAPRRSHSG